DIGIHRAAEESGNAMKRREALQLLGAAPVAAAIVWTPVEAERAHEQAQRTRRDNEARGAAFQPRFFTAHEYATVGVLVDLIIPKEERWGSATDAGVPEFMDFMMLDQPRRQTAMRGGLALIDRLSESRFGTRFITATAEQRAQLLDDIAYLATAPRE